MHSLDPVEDLSMVLVRRFLLLCENPRTRSTMLRLVRGSTGSARSGRRFYRVVNRTVLSPVMRANGVQQSALKTELIASHLIGIAVMRYVVKVEPMASASVEEVVTLLAPSIQVVLSSAPEKVVLPPRSSRLAVPVPIPVPRTIQVPIRLPRRIGISPAGPGDQPAD